MLKLPRNKGLNIVPFIDIMLILLAVILGISTFITHGKIEINLPASENALSPNSDRKKLSISIDENNIFYLDDRTTDLKGLSDAISSFHKRTIVELKDDKNAKFGSFVQIIDLLKTKERGNFQIITEKNR